MNSNAMSPAMRHRKYAPLLHGCAIALTLAAMARTPLVHGQAFQGTPTLTAGSASVGQSGNTDTITVFSDQVVLDWAPTDTSGTGTINFLPNGSTAIFQDSGSPTLPTFTVLNRIQPTDATRAISLNGSVQSQAGGAIWFYSPGGIIVGSTATFNVGSLLLTTNTIAVDPTNVAGNYLFGAGGQISFTGATNSTSSVAIQSGAQINALATGSYVALVAPRVVQGGTVNVNGSAAYVGAEAVDITINGGLFDIAFGTGTGDANGVVHSGTTNVTPDTSTQRVFMAAMPKNNALTMLLSGTIGYSPAAMASVQDSAIVLSAGHDISFGLQQSAPNNASTAAANISIGNGTYDPALDAQASGSITVSPTSFGTINFNDATTLKAVNAVTVGADNGETINAASDLTVYAGLDGAGGMATVYADGIPFSTPPVGQINVTGTLTVDSSAIGADDFTPGATGGSATGGTSELRVTGGNISTGSLNLLSMAAGGYGESISGLATGGTALLTVNSGSISASDLSMDVSASNAFFSQLTPQNGGNAVGGTAQISIDGGSLSITACSNCSIRADGVGGTGPTGGQGMGGSIMLTASDGSFTSDGTFNISASGFGGDTPDGGTTGTGTGGDVVIQLLSGANGTAAMSFGDLMVSADGYGLPDNVEFFSVGSGGDGHGGTATIDLLGGTLTANSLDLSASGYGGAAGESFGPTPFTAGDGFGGQSIFNVNDGTANITTDLSIFTTGEGGYAQSPSDAGLMGVTGNGFGGTTQLVGTAGALNAANIYVHAYGAGGASGSTFDGDVTSGGNGLGGTVSATWSGGTLSATSLDVAAAGGGGDGGDIFTSGASNAGAGGTGTGGTASLSLLGGNVTLSSLSVSADGRGGLGGDNQGSGNTGDGGSGFGGTARLETGNADYTLNSVTVEALGIGGTGGVSSLGLPNGLDGSGSGGLAGFSYSATTAPVIARTLTALALDVSGFGSTSNSGRIEVARTGSYNGLAVAGNFSALGSGAPVGNMSGFYFTGSGAPFRIGGNAVIDVPGNVDFNSSGSGIFTVGGTLLVNASGAITANDLITSGTAQFTAQSIDVHSSGALNVTNATATAGNLALAADNGVTIGTGTASGTLSLASAAGNVSATTLTGTSLSIDTVGTATFNGSAQGQSIDISSGNIVIAPGAQIGTAGSTTSISLANSNSGLTTYIGGTNTTAGYSLSAAEIGRLFANSITFAGSAGQDVVINSFTISSTATSSAGNIGPTGSLSINSFGDISVLGDVALTGLGAGNQLFLNAANAIMVDAANASISLSDGSGGLIGQLNFDANEVFIATASAIADVQGATMPGATTRLAQNDGINRNTPVISAATIFANVGSGLYIQNIGVSGAADDRRGFVALTDTLDIVTGSANTRIIVNGQLVDPATGSVLTGFSVVPLVRVNGVVGPTSGSFDPRSTVNGCLLASPTACITNVNIPIDPPPYETIEEPLDPERHDGSTSGGNLFPTMTVELQDFQPFGYPPLIDEPVTGAGNDDLWMPACDETTEAGCNP
ncbi:beta strand repeat-containing protein [Rhizorhapis sp. SPR117]|uniref:beta strand repeat-containing protein n=1 Tax=Rhizorhapis sp. SPR117 TaxID=2912611 RepID=UPI001F1D5C96|nr:hypothetical protein [Rhizorhapis sp. SPR117]